MFYIVNMKDIEILFVPYMVLLIGFALLWIKFRFMEVEQGKFGVNAVYTGEIGVSHTLTSYKLSFIEKPMYLGFLHLCKENKHTVMIPRDFQIETPDGYKIISEINSFRWFVIEYERALNDIISYYRHVGGQS